MTKGAYLYFHCPCFDGIVSAVIAWSFLETFQGWTVHRLVPVDYGSRGSWLKSDMPDPSAVVDFLYHPQARFWADHHVTTFLSEDMKEHFQRCRTDRWLIYDERARSCASLLWESLQDSFRASNPHVAELVGWADKIDSASYDSVKEAILGDAPALQIRATLMLKDGSEYCQHLVQELRRTNLAEVAGLPEVKQRSQQARSMIEAGLDRFSAAVRIEDDIVIFDVGTDDVIINRYAPFFFYPDARYSIGVIRSETGIRITAMRNPWRQLPSAPLGKIFAKFGGGGHERVGALLLPWTSGAQPKAMLEQLIREIRKQDPVAAALVPLE